MFNRRRKKRMNGYHQAQCLGNDTDAIAGVIITTLHTIFKVRRVEKNDGAQKVPTKQNFSTTPLLTTAISDGANGVA